MTNTMCVNCKAELPDDPADQPRLPCPDCGSTSRSFTDSIVDSLITHDGHRVKVKRPSLPSAKKLRADMYSGVEHSHKHGKLVRVHRTIDKDCDRYIEEVTDMQTGEVLHECDEPLSEHIDHGTAKGRREP